MVVHNAQILEFLQHHLVRSISNETQAQLHPSQVTMKNAVEQIHEKILASVPIPHLQRILLMTIWQNWSVDTEGGEVLEEEEDIEEEEEEEEDNEKEGKEEDETASNDDVEHSVIVAA
jgi:hypothetical protein